MNEALLKQWDSLTECWRSLGSSSIEVEHTVTGWRVVEYFKGNIVYDYVRNFDGTRITFVESSLIGLTSLAFDPALNVYVTEGVSDFLALKILLPYYNVVGHTRLYWNSKDVQFLSNYNKVIICSDNDLTGLKAVAEARSKFPANKVQILLPYFTTSKDVADDYMRIIQTNEYKEHVINHYKSTVL